MKLRTRMNAAVGAGVLATLSLTAWGLSSAQAAPVTGAAASAALAHRMISVHEPKGRAGDGHGGEHSGGSSRDGHHSKAKPKGKKADNRHDNHGGGTNGNNGGDHGGNHGGGHDGGHGCHYPPSRSHQVVLNAPSKGHGRTLTLTGKVTHNGCGVSYAKVGLYSSHDGSTGWVLINKAKVGKDGSFSFQVSSKGSHYYQSVVAPDQGHDPAASGIVSSRHR